jgi:hypothetical protein
MCETVCVWGGRPVGEMRRGRNPGGGDARGVGRGTAAAWAGSSLGGPYCSTRPARLIFDLFQISNYFELVKYKGCNSFSLNFFKFVQVVYKFKKNNFLFRKEFKFQKYFELQI